jgi:hypothetical protein
MRRHTVIATVLVAAAPLFVGAPAQAVPESPAIALTWQSIAYTTVYPAKAVPVGTVFLAYTSRAVHQAARASLNTTGSSETAAVAQAAHDVLAHYFPTAQGTLDTKLAESLALVPDGAAQDLGVAIGAQAADAVIADRAGDGVEDSSVVYAKPDGIGVWQADGRGFVGVWLGYVDRFVGGRPVPVDGPDAVGTAAYRADLAEVRAVGRAGADADKAAVANFFAGTSPAVFGNALIAYLSANPRTLMETTELFADINNATAEGVRQAWRLKHRVGFWRPFEAIQQDDGDPLTTEDPSWTPVLVTPPYPEYSSGHQVVTSSFTGVVDCHLGNVPLTLTIAGGATRSYTSLETMRMDAFNSRIWGGIHFRDAMEDSYEIGSTIVARVCG